MRKLFVAFAVTLPVVGLLAQTPAGAATSHAVARRVGPVRSLRVFPGASTSSNWSGYAALEGSQPFTKVSGKWVQPAVNCSKTPTGYSSFWVGLDGYSSGTVEQDGTAADCSGGTASYHAWWEMYPQPERAVFNISAGDLIVAKVTYKSGTFTLTLTDKTSGQAFTEHSACAASSCPRSSAEWIAEAPSSGGILPLADFGTANFTASKAGIPGHNGTITDSHWSYDEITMTSGGHVKAQPGPLNGAGTAFSVTWKAST
jgi:hypothetical protein